MKPIILPRAIQEHKVANPDGTCGQGDQCRHKLDYGSSIAGTALDFGDRSCVLCTRWYVHQCFLNNTPISKQVFTCIDDEYSMGDYLPMKPEIHLTFPMVSYTALEPFEETESKLVNIFDIITDDREYNTTKVYVCKGPKCKPYRVVNVSGKSYANGFVKCAYDILSGSMSCISCDTKVIPIESDLYENFNVEGTYYSKCGICDSLTDTRFTFYQLCAHCLSKINVYINKSSKNCYFCETMVNEKKRKSYVLDTGVVYLCKNHTLSRRLVNTLKTGEVIKESTFISMLHQKRRRRSRKAIKEQEQEQEQDD